LLSKTNRTSIESGLDFVADLSDLNHKLEETDFVITGEGSFDAQTLEGKAVAQILKMALKHRK
jgi:glycerate 2-kinase